MMDEIVNAILLLDGYKAYGEYAHKNAIDFLKTKYKQLKMEDIETINSLRIIRNKISYDGFFVRKEFVKDNENNFKDAIAKLKRILKEKLA